MLTVEPVFQANGLVVQFGEPQGLITDSQLTGGAFYLGL